MRPVIVVATLGAVIAAVALADLVAPSYGGVVPGSVGVEPLTDDLRLLSFDPAWDDPACAEALPDEEPPCPRTYAYQPGGAVTVWVSVRNDGILPLTLEGVSERWLAQYDDVAPLAAPRESLDGGALDADLAALRPRPFEPVVLRPGDERMVGVRIVAPPDVAAACASSAGGGGVSWEGVMVSWHLLATSHAQFVPFDRPVAVRAPSAEQCAA